jgi:hypothetical protein
MMPSLDSGTTIGRMEHNQMPCRALDARGCPPLHMSLSEKCLEAFHDG